MTERKSNPRALVIDDEPDIRELLSITLGRMQIEVVTAGDYASAIKALGPERFDLVLTDMRFPTGTDSTSSIGSSITALACRWP